MEIQSIKQLLSAILVLLTTIAGSLGISINSADLRGQDPILGARTVVFTPEGGTGTSSRPVAGDILLSQAAGSYGPATLLQGTNVTIATSTDSGGRGTVTISSTGGGSDFAWTPVADGNSTSTRLIFGNGFISQASSTVFGGLSIDRSTSTNATSTTFRTETLTVGGNATTTSAGALSLGSTLIVTGTSDLQGAVSDSGGNLQLADTVEVTGTNQLGVGTTTPWGTLSVHHAAGEVAFAVGSSTATSFVVDASGNVGIGTTSPAQKLDVVGRLIVRGSGSTGGIDSTPLDGDAYMTVNRPANSNIAAFVMSPAGALSASNVNWYLGMQVSTNNFSFTTWPGSGGTTERLTLSNAGDVTFTGTLSDSNSDVTISDGLVVTGTSDLRGAISDSVGNLELSDTVEVTGANLFGIGTTTPWAQLSVDTDAGVIPFAIGSSTATYLVLDDNGRLGIGDTTPAALLTVGASDAFQVDSSGRVFANVGASGAGNLAYSFVGDTDTGLYRSAVNEVRLQTNGADRLTVEAGGEVGIGTSTPQRIVHVDSGATATTTVRIGNTVSGTAAGCIELADAITGAIRGVYVANGVLTVDDAGCQ